MSEMGTPTTGAAAPATPAPGPKPKRGYLLPGAIALVVLAVIATVVDLTALQSHDPSTLAGQDVATEISQALQARHPQAVPPAVSCPSREPERAGLVFDCTLQPARGAKQTVRVTETSAGGLFRFQLLPAG